MHHTKFGPHTVGQTIQELLQGLPEDQMEAKLELWRRLSIEVMAQAQAPAYTSVIDPVLPIVAGLGKGLAGVENMEWAIQRAYERAAAERPAAIEALRARLSGE